MSSEMTIELNVLIDTDNAQPRMASVLLVEIAKLRCETGLQQLVQ
jgi:hypothetical protein